MISPKNPLKNKLNLQNQLKLPQIPSRKQIHSLKKNSPPIPDLPNIKNKPKHNLSVNKQNNSINLLSRKNSLDDQIKARLFQVQAAEKMVKNVLGAAQATVNVGGDMTNFQHKIQVNRQILRKQRNKSHFNQQNPNLPQDKKNQQNEHKAKCVSSKQIASQSVKPISIKQDMKINIKQNNQFDKQNKKDDLSSENGQKEKIRFKSQRRPKNVSKPKNQQDSKVFKSIKQILSDPQKVALEMEAKKVKKMVKFTIEQLENKLRKMNNFQKNKSFIEAHKNKSQSNKFDRKLISAKSVGMIPIIDTPICEEYTFKNQNKVQISQPQQQGNQFNENNAKIVKYYKSDFEQQVDQIQKLQMKSYKSIQKMVQNRKLLIDLQLLNMKTKSFVMKQKGKSQKQKQSSV